MLDIVHKSWFMFFRRLYLSYNVALAALLIAMQGLSFGIQLFYKFRLVELDDQFNRFSTMMSQSMHHPSYTIPLLFIFIFLHYNLCEE